MHSEARDLEGGNASGASSAPYGVPTFTRMRDLWRPSRRVFVAAALVIALLLAAFAAMVVDAQHESRRGLEERFRLAAELTA